VALLFFASGVAGRIVVARSEDAGYLYPVAVEWQ
jgi:hypothetical protein